MVSNLKGKGYKNILSPQLTEESPRTNRTEIKKSTKKELSQMLAKKQLNPKP